MDSEKRVEGSNAKREVVVLQGLVPTDEEKFFVEAQRRLVERSPEVIAGAAQQVMMTASLLSVVYLAALGVVKAPDSLVGNWRLILLVPYAFWLPALLCAWGAFSPRYMEIPRGGGQETCQRLMLLARTKARWLRASYWLLFSGVVAMAFTILVCFTI